MDFIIALFMYLGLVSSGEEVTQTMVDQNANTIEYYQNDADFLQYYENQQEAESIGILDHNDL